MAVCHACKLERPTGGLYCDNCARLQLVTVPTAPLSEAETQGVLETADFVPIGSSSFGPGHLLRLDIVDHGQTLIFKPVRYVVLGRSPRGAVDHEYLDLMPYEALAHGVSRVHAAIAYDDHNVYLIDKGSRNGTYLEGRRLSPETPYLLRNGHDIRLGTLAITVTFRVGQALRSERG